MSDEWPPSFVELTASPKVSVVVAAAVDLLYNIHSAALKTITTSRQ